jgi:hypothetical protein
MGTVRLLRGTLEAAGEVFYKSTDGVVILPVRKRAYYPFSAPGWTDLRLAFFLSITGAFSDDTITGLAETLAGVTAPADRYWIGIRNGFFGLPRFQDATYKTTFIGFTNSKPTNGATEAADNSILSSSDEGVGTTNTNFWFPHNSTQDFHSAMIIDGTTVLDGSATGLQQHFVQNELNAGGYAVLLGMRLLRESPTALTVQASFKSSTLSADMLYSSVPTKELVRDSIEVWPTDAQQVLESGVDMSEVPSGFLFYWCFTQSRLRIHALGILSVI